MASKLWNEIETLKQSAESGEQWAEICRLEALALEEDGSRFTPDEYEALRRVLMLAKDDDITAILSNNYNVILGALRTASTEQAA